MKILHTADWHLGQNFYCFDRTNEYIDFFRQLKGIVAEEQPDALVISGDIFDTAVPSNAIVKLYNNELIDIVKNSPDMKIVVISGNHDSPSKLEVAESLWANFNVSIIGTLNKVDNCYNYDKLIVPVVHDNETIAYILAVPYIHASNYPPLGDSYADKVAGLYKLLLFRIADRPDNVPVIALGHLSVANADFSGHKVVKYSDNADDLMPIIGGVDSVTADVFDDALSYVALGHFHQAQHLGQENVRYAGSPIAVSFDEKYKHFVTIAEFNGADLKDVRLKEITPLKPLFDIADKAVPFEDAKKMVAALPNDLSAYLRVNVLVEGVNIPNMFEQISELTENKKVNLCLVRPVYPETEAKQSPFLVESVAHFKEMSPLDIANYVYKEKYSIEMPDELKKCFSLVINELSTEEGV
ncbi:MAG: exonuclease SbcCD subunit D [Bacteroidales bacterium]|jgi:DNA repair protein SbcD/Mre11|nr:exonuclease SbcCD subunit D [Bacteroidales bacterium]MDD2205174.1 exonuclease SbcCD subunit D [Bacteroidales bacterium]MDD3153079.1 exonuclease SbcCD subunit D [Bacteroidales bacterium]MDD3914700.1 exonuclease SbcCD subunit D [Bacteroidales bacterium]MDD4634560.1 exonuclease SbcCD subunit D [Bacteroidales bacterium]